MLKYLTTVSFLFLAGCGMGENASSSSNVGQAAPDVDAPTIGFDSISHFLPGNESVRLVSDKLLTRDLQIRLLVTEFDVFGERPPNQGTDSHAVNQNSSTNDDSAESSSFTEISSIGMHVVSFKINSSAKEIKVNIPENPDVDGMKRKKYAIIVQPSSDYKVSSQSGILYTFPRHLISIYTGYLPPYSSNRYEGEDIEFIIESLFEMSEDCAIAVEVEQFGGNYLPANKLGFNTIVIPKGSQAKEFVLKTLDDSVLTTGGGSITVNLLDSEIAAENLTMPHGDCDYEITATPEFNSASAVVLDRESFTVFVQADKTRVMEGKRIRFNIGGSQDSLLDEIEVNLKVEQKGQFVDGVLPTTLTLMRNTGYKGILEFDTDEDFLEVMDGQLTVSILPGTGYQPDGTLSSATVIIEDNDLNPDITIKERLNSVNFGTELPFRITALSKTLPKGMPVLLTVLLVNGNSRHEYDETIVLEGGGEYEDIYINLDDSSLGSGLESATVRVRIKESERYFAVSGSDEAELTVIRSSQDSIIRLSPSVESVVEGKSAIFELQASISTIGILLNLEITETGQFLKYNKTRELIPRGSNNVNMEIETVDDDLFERNGSITARILPGNGYLLDQDQDTATVRILDNDEIEIFVANFKQFVHEGETAEFAIGIEGEPIGFDLEIHLDITSIGDFFTDEPPLSFTLRKGMNIDYLRLETFDNDFYEPDGSISVEIIPNPRFRLLEISNRATMEIHDNDETPEIFVANFKQFVHEGKTAEFAIGIEGEPIGFDLEIPLYITAIGDFFTDEPPPFFTLRKGMNIGYLRLETIDNDFDQPDGSISVEVLADPRFSLKENSAVATMEIRDNDETPEIFVANFKQFVHEGKTAEFAIGIEGNPIGFDLEIPLMVTFVGDYYRGEPPQSFTLRSGMNIDYLRFETLDDAFELPDGSISVEVLADPRFSLKENSAVATIEIRDNDEDLQVFVAKASEFVIEGESADFVIGSDLKPAPQDIVISVLVTDSNGFLANDSPETFILPKGKYIDYLRLDTKDDRIVEADGKIIVRILPGLGYEVLNDSSVSEIQVRDNEPVPVVSIEAFRTEVGKGDMVRFRVSATMVQTFDMPVGLELMDAGNLALGSAVNGIKIKAEMETVEFDVSTNADAVGQGSFSIRLLESFYYHRDDRLHTAEVQVYDWPLIGVEQAQTGQLMEGGQATFRLISRESRLVPLNVSYIVSQSEMQGTGVFTETFFAGRQGQTFEVATVDNDSYTHGSKINVELQQGSGYRVSNSYHSNASIFITDNDKPTISIVPKQSVSIKEGELAGFVINASDRSLTDLQVNLRIDHGSESFLNQPRTTVTLPAGSTGEFFEIQTYKNASSDSDGRLNVEVVEGLGYDPAQSPSNTAEVAVTNVELPVLFIATEKSSVVEGEDAVFVIQALSSSTTPANQIALGYNLTIGVHRTRTGEQPSQSDIANWTLPAGESQLKKRIPTDDWNSIAISLPQAQNYELHSQYPSTATVSVESVPEDDGSNAGSPVSISISHINPVAEGTGKNPIFKLTADRPAKVGRTINLNVTGALNFVESSIPNSVILYAGSSIATLEIPIHDDDVDDADGEIMVEILDPTNAGDYSIGTPSAAKVTVRDDETPPTISISGSGTVTEGPGSKAVFTLNASRMASTVRNINISVSGASNFLSLEDVPKFVPLNANSAGSTLELAIADDDTEENAENLTVTILPATAVDDYWIGTGNSATVKIEDNDSDAQMTMRSAVNETEGDASDRDGIIPPDVNIPSLPDQVAGLMSPFQNSNPKVTINARQPKIEEGSVAEFQISVSHVQSTDLTIFLIVDLATGGIGNLMQENVTLKAGKKTVDYEIRTRDDNFAGEDKTVSVEIVHGYGYETDSDMSIATVRVSDEIDRARRDRINQANRVVLPALLEEVGSNPISTAIRRIKQNFSGNRQTAKIGGQSNLKDMILTGGRMINDTNGSWNPLTGNSSFNIPLAGQLPNGGVISVWGDGVQNKFNQRHDSSNLDGDLETANLGIDMQLSDNFLPGMSVFQSETKAEFNSIDGGVLKYNTQSTGMYPYFGWVSSDRNARLQVAAGYSEGGMEIDQDGFDSYHIDNSVFSAGFSGKVILLDMKNALRERSFELNLESDSWFARQHLRGDFNYLEERELESGFSRISLEGANHFAAGEDSSLRPSASIGVFGRIGYGYGFDLTGGVSYENSHGYAISTEGQSYLTVNGQSLSLSGKMDFDRNGDGLGMILSMSPVWNHGTRSGMRSILNYAASEFGGSTIQYGARSQLNAKIGYGFDIWKKSGVFTPYGEVGLIEGVQNKLTLGSSFTIESDLKFEFEWVESNRFDSNSIQAVNARCSLKW